MNKDRVREVEGLVKEYMLCFQDACKGCKHCENFVNAIVASQEKREKELREVWEKWKDCHYYQAKGSGKTLAVDLWQAINNYFGEKD